MLTLLAAALTAFYSWRLMLRVFHGVPAAADTIAQAHESPMSMLVPLGVLAAGAFLTGWPFANIFTGPEAESFFHGSLKIPASVLAERPAPWLIALLPTLMMLVGLAIAWQFYIRRPELPVRLARSQAPLYRFLLKAWYFDQLYDFLLVRPLMWLGRLLWKGGDGWLIDGFGPDGISARVVDITRNVVRLQTGYLYHYAFAMLIGVAAFITWFMVNGATP